MTMDVDGILFDWGGTLARVATQLEAWHRGAVAACDVLARRGHSHPNSVPLLFQVMNDAEHRAGADPNHAEVRVPELFEAWAKACHWPAVDASLRDQAVDAFGHCWVGCLDPFPGVIDAVGELHNRGYRLGLASNCWTPLPYSLAELRRQGLESLLHGVTISCEVGYRKPSRVFYEAALSALDGQGPRLSPDRVLFVGDSPMYDVAGPAAMGMKTALVSSPPGAWPAEHYGQISPDLRIDSVAELLPHLPGR